VSGERWSPFCFGHPDAPVVAQDSLIR
jgi:hypothetical protein